MLDFPSFRSLLASHLAIDLHDHGPECLLHDELGFDSLTMAEISLLFAHDGIELPDDLLTELRTLGDLHHYHEVLSVPGAVHPGAAPTGTDR